MVYRLYNIVYNKKSLAILLIISLGICGVLAVRAHMRRKKLLKKILQLQFNKTIAEVGLALIAPIQG